MNLSKIHFFLFCDLIGQSFVPEKISLNAFVLISDVSNKITRKNTEREKNMRHNSHLSSEFILKNTNKYMNYLACSLLFESISELIILTVKNKDLEKIREVFYSCIKIKTTKDLSYKLSVYKQYFD